MTNIMQKRFEDALKKLTADLEMKSSQRVELKERQQLKKAGILMDTIEDTDPDNAGLNDSGREGNDDDADLFGDESDVGMNIA